MDQLNEEARPSYHEEVIVGDAPEVIKDKLDKIISVIKTNEKIILDFADYYMVIPEFKDRAQAETDENILSYIRIEAVNNFRSLVGLLKRNWMKNKQLLIDDLQIAPVLVEGNNLPPLAVTSTTEYLELMLEIIHKLHIEMDTIRSVLIQLRIPYECLHEHAETVYGFQSNTQRVAFKAKETYNEQLRLSNKNLNSIQQDALTIVLEYKHVLEEAQRLIEYEHSDMWLIEHARLKHTAF